MGVCEHGVRLPAGGGTASTEPTSDPTTNPVNPAHLADLTDSPPTRAQTTDISAYVPHTVKTSDHLLTNRSFRILLALQSL
jgi:hypothetical protein